MRPNWWKDWFYRSLKVAEWVFIGLTILVGAFGILLDPNDIRWLWLLQFQKWINANSGWLVVAFPFGAGVCEALSKGLGEPWYWKTIQNIVDSFQRRVFEKLGNVISDDHRVTLYKYKKTIFGNEKLVPIIRSGPRNKRTRKTWDLNNPNRQYGVAGHAFLNQGGDVLLKDLPDVFLGVEESVYVEYAKNTFVSVDWLKDRVRSGRPCARYFFAMRVEVNNKRWGVLMIDSREVQPPNPTVASHEFRVVATVFNVLLERA